MAISLSSWSACACRWRPSMVPSNLPPQTLPQLGSASVQFNPTETVAPARSKGCSSRPSTACAGCSCRARIRHPWAAPLSPLVPSKHASIPRVLRFGHPPPLYCSRPLPRVRRLALYTHLYATHSPRRLALYTALAATPLSLIILLYTAHCYPFASSSLSSGRGPGCAAKPGFPFAREGGLDVHAVGRHRSHPARARDEGFLPGPRKTDPGIS